MRNNQPVTQREYDFAADATLLSTTDTMSHITYANAAFIHVSGFENDEILGQPHNLVRHPDMPREAFADMWATLKAGYSWTALVKNRRKNGDHYWVRANATPVTRNGKSAGYMSVRTKPSRDEIAATEALYRDFREGKQGRRAFHHGLIVRTGLLAWMSCLQVMPTCWRARLPMFACYVLAMLFAWEFSGTGFQFASFALATASTAILATLWLETQIVRPLGQVLEQALAVAAGQPGENLHLNRVDEIGMILRAVNQAGLNLRSLVSDVGEQLSGLQSASGEIVSGNGDLNARSEQSAANLEETAASMEEMTATVRNNAETVRQASSLAGEAREAASQGGDIVGEVVDTMKVINGASQKIREITGVIDSIAFQTNILALNASVEAARAGELGRGFAVVAGEVRALAQRSAGAAKEISGLINDNVEKIETGNALVDKAGSAMQGIVTQVARVAEMLDEIGVATDAQSAGIGQVNVAVTQLDEMTQQNASLVRELGAASDGLQSRTVRLTEAIAVFEDQAKGRAVAHGVDVTRAGTAAKASSPARKTP